MALISVNLFYVQVQVVFWLDVRVIYNSRLSSHFPDFTHLHLSPYWPSLLRVYLQVRLEQYCIFISISSADSRLSSTTQPCLPTLLSFMAIWWLAIRQFPIAQAINSFKRLPLRSRLIPNVLCLVLIRCVLKLDSYTGHQLWISFFWKDSSAVFTEMLLSVRLDRTVYQLWKSQASVVPGMISMKLQCVCSEFCEILLTLCCLY